MEYPVKFLKLINSLKTLNGVGSKSAEKMAFDILKMDKEKRDALSSSILDINMISKCPICGNLSEDNDSCEICKDNSRDNSIICVVYQPKDVFAFEKIKEYHGLYHVLNGYINPSKNMGADSINLQSLLDRIKNNKNIKEIVLATDLTMEGEITAMYIYKVLSKSFDGTITRLAHGLPMGAELNYADELTLFKSFSNRKEFDK